MKNFFFFSAEDVLYQVMYLGLFVEFLVLKRAVRPRVRALSLVLFLSTELGYNGRSTLHISSYLSRRDSQKSAASEWMAAQRAPVSRHVTSWRRRGIIRARRIMTSVRHILRFRSSPPCHKADIPSVRILLFSNLLRARARNPSISTAVKKSKRRCRPDEKTRRWRTELYSKVLPHEPRDRGWLKRRLQNDLFSVEWDAWNIKGSFTPDPAPRAAPYVTASGVKELENSSGSSMTDCWPTATMRPVNVQSFITTTSDDWSRPD